MIVYPPGYPTKDLDCDFGRVTPEAIRAFTVRVWPKSQKTRSLNEWHMIILLPDDDKLEVNLDYEQIVRSVAEHIVDQGDKYMIDPFKAEPGDEPYARSTPVISFDPRRVDEGILLPIWITPRREMMS